jgi:WD40 repeat protein
VGLVPYNLDDSAFFFGRDRDRKVIVANMRSNRLTLLYGASGVGKSSVLKAGVAHDVQVLADRNRAEVNAPHLAIAVFNEWSSWRHDLMAGVAHCVREAASAALNGSSQASLDGSLEQAAERIDGELLVVLDQFEEYFLYANSEDGPGTLAYEFPRLVYRTEVPISFLISIRDDALARLDRFKSSIPDLFANRYQLEYLNSAAAHDAIARPLVEWERRFPDEHVEIEAGLIDAVLDDVRVGRGHLALAADDLPIEPRLASFDDRFEAPVLQLVMKYLWEQDHHGPPPYVLRNATFEAVGAEKIVQRHLRSQLDSLPRAQRDVAAQVFRFLVTSSGTKISHSAEDLAGLAERDVGRVSAVLDTLASREARILREVPGPPHQPEVKSYEIFHDVLARPILEWRGEQLRRMAAERRVRRIATVAVPVAIALLVVVGLLVLLAKTQRDSLQTEATRRAELQDQRTQASEARNEAVLARATAEIARGASEQQATLALGRQLGFRGVGGISTSIDLRLLLAVEVYRFRDTPQSRGAVLGSLVQAPRVVAHQRGQPLGGYWMAFSPDGTTVASADVDQMIHLWDVANGQPLGQPFAGQTSRVLSLAFSPDGKTLASAGDDWTIRQWDVATGRPLSQQLAGHSGRVLTMAFASDGKRLASASDDRTIQLWDVATGRPLSQPLTGHTGTVYSVAFSPDGRTLASADADQMIRLWDVGSGSPRPFGQPLTGHTGAVYSVAFAPDGKMLASASEDRTIRLWDVGRGEPGSQTFSRLLSGHTGLVYSVAFAGDQNTLASASADGSIRLWDSASGQPVGEPLAGYGELVTRVAFAPDGKTLASVSSDRSPNSDRKIHLWDVAGGQPLDQPLSGPTDLTSNVAYSPDGKILATGGHNGSIHLWDVASGQSRGQPLPAHTRPVNSVAFAPDGRTLASGGADGTIRLWDIAGGGPIGTLAGHAGPVNSVAFAPDGRILASASDDRMIRLWDVATGRLLGQQLAIHAGPVNSVAFAPDGRIMASASQDRTIRLWDVANGKPLGQLLDHKGWVLNVAFSPDGKTLASASQDRTIRLWDIATGRPLGQPLTGHTDQVRSVTFSPDGKTLASASEDGTIRLWDVASHQSLGLPLGQPSSAGGHWIVSVAFSPDGFRLASASSDGMVRLWDVDPQSWAHRACALAHRNLTHMEWTQFVGAETPYERTCPDLPDGD